jgi:protein transport protein SEC24
MSCFFCITGVADYGGFYCKRTPTDVDLPALDCDKAIMCSMRYEERLNDGGEAYVQCALLYTTIQGERRIRVHTMALPVTSVLVRLIILFYIRRMGDWTDLTSCFVYRATCFARRTWRRRRAT